jgi:transcriptional regulator with XRE-family HTH domain
MKRSNAATAELRMLSEGFGNQARLAEVLDVHKSTITRWLKGEDMPDTANEEQIAALRYLAVRLLRLFRPEVAIDWLEGVNAFLRDQRPVDLIRNGRISEVLAAIEQTEAGSYA